MVSSARAALNEQINYQGKLTNSSNVAVSDGDYNIQVRLCADSSCSSVLWTETRTSTNKVALSNGLFSILLGSVTSLTSVDFNQSIYLELQVGGTGTPSWETLLPRKLLGTVPSAFESKKLGGKLESALATLSEDESVSGAWSFSNILSLTVSSTSSTLTVLQSGSGSGISVGNGTATTTINGGSTSTFPYGATFAATDGSVGIGTTTVSSKLTIQGSGATSATVSLNVLNSAGISSLYVRDDGRVGIGGITNPATSLHIGHAGDANTTAFIASAQEIQRSQITNSTANNWSEFLFTNAIGTNSAAFAIQHVSHSAQNGIFTIATSRAVGNTLSESIRIDNYGRLMVGTISGTARFNVTTAASTMNGFDLNVIGEAYGTTYSAQSVYRPLGTVIDIINSTANTNSANLIYFENYLATSKYTGAYFGSVAGTVTSGPSNLVFGYRTAASTWAESARIDANGYLGIGTTAPDKQLEINSATGANLRLTYNDSNGSAANYTDFSVGSDGGLTISPTNSATTTISNGLVVNTDSLVVSKSTGYVGIGSSTPNYDLSVNGSAYLALKREGFEGSTVPPSGYTASGPNTTWLATTTDVYVGSKSLQTPVTSASSSSTLSTTVSFDATTTISFWWRVSSESDWDFFGFCIDRSDCNTSKFATQGVDYDYRISGTGTTWAEITSAVSSGSHTFKWQYFKDSTTDVGSDAGFLDEVYLGNGGKLILENYLKVNSNILVNTSSSGGASYKIMVDSGSSSGAGIGVNGYIKASGFITGTTTLDLAETYPFDSSCTASSTCPVEGDLVCVDSSLATGVKKCNATSTENLIGVVSANPGFLLGGFEFGSLHATNTVKIALAGRVPIKVNITSGTIKIGDELAVGAVDGTAQKALEPGQVVGLALENFGKENEPYPQTGTVLVFLNPHWSIGSLEEKNIPKDLPDFSTTTSNILDKFTLVIENSLQKLGLVIKNGVAKLKEIFVDKLFVKELCVGDTCIGEPQLKELLEKNQVSQSQGSVLDNNTIINNNLLSSSTNIVNPNFVSSSSNNADASSTILTLPETLLSPSDSVATFVSGTVSGTVMLNN